MLVACLMFLSGLATELSAQSRLNRPQPKYAQGEPDQAEGAKTLDSFRSVGIAGDYYLQFQLRVMPRRGDERLVEGRLWGTRKAEGPLTRLTVNPGQTDEHRVLVQSGSRPAVWDWTAQAGLTAMDDETWFAHLADTDLTAFDLAMPFLYWGDFVYEGLERVRGRPAHAFLMYPPSNSAAQKAGISGVRIYLDAQYNALVQAELIGADLNLLKAITVMELKKIDDQWIVKTIDLRDEQTRNKTRFIVTGAALQQHLQRDTFTPASLTNAARSPAESLITTFSD